MKKSAFTSLQFDASVLLGILGAFACILISIGLYSSLGAFINTPSFLIVIGGTLCACFVCYPASEVVTSLGVVLKLIFSLFTSKENVPDMIMHASEASYTNGVLSLQKSYMSQINPNTFWATGLNLLIDGLGGKECDDVMRAEMMSRYDNQMNAVSLLNKMAEIAPAMGLVGTLVGLVQMLSTLSDPSTIGPAMAVAILTTFYGAVFAYLFCIPLACRLEKKAAETLADNELCLLGFKAVDSAQNPRKTQMELNALLPPNAAVSYFEEG